jgi:hypothetical protein
LSFANSHVCSCGPQTSFGAVLGLPLAEPAALAEMSSDDCPVGEASPEPQPKTKSVLSANKVEATKIDFMNVSFRALRDPNRSRGLVGKFSNACAVHTHAVFSIDRAA